MRYKALFTLLFTLLSGNALSDWKKINDFLDSSSSNKS